MKGAAMKKLMGALSVVIFLWALSGTVHAAQPTPVAKGSSKAQKHKKPGKKGMKKGNSKQAKAIPLQPGKAVQPTATPEIQPQKHWWKFW